MSGVVVLILAAGQGQRFRDAGGVGHKLDAVLAGKSVLARTIEAATASGLAVHVVNTSTAGMGWSIAAGVRATAEAAGWLILPGDMPLVSPETIREVAQSLSAVAVVVPWYQDKRGHPVGFSAACRDHLLALSGDEGARGLIPLFPSIRLSVDDPGCIFDIDTPDDLNHASQSLFGADDE